MRVNDVIVLDDDKRYSLLETTDYEGETYFLAIHVNEKNEPDYKEIIILRSVEDEDGMYVETVMDDNLIIKLTKIFEGKM